MKSFILNRGCAFRCSYCYHQQFLGLYGREGYGGVRHRTPDNIIEEMLYVKENYPLDLVRINDPSIAFNAKWLREFCEKYRGRIGLPFTCNIFPGQANDEWMQLLKGAGCKAVFWAVESGNDHMRMHVLNRRVTKDTLYKTNKLIKKYGMNSIVQNMVGLPKGSLDMDIETLDVNIKLKPHYSWVSIFQPYPGTPLYDEAIKDGYFDGDVDKIEDTYHIDSVMNIMDKKKVENLQKIFAIAVEFSFLRPLVPFLISLPFGGIYDFFRKLWKGYCFSFRAMPYRLSMAEYISTGIRAMLGKGG